MTEPTLKIGPSGYKLDPNKLKEAPRQILPYLFSCFSSKLTAERNYEYKFDKIIGNFEYAKENGQFPYLNLAYTTTKLSAGSLESSFVIKQGSNHKGYYTFGNRRYFKIYMPDKPNMIVKFFMKTCLGLVWVDEAL